MSSYSQGNPLDPLGTAKPAPKKKPKPAQSSAPPAPPPPPPPDTKKGAQGKAAYTAYINAHPKLKRYSQVIYQTAIAEGLDPVYWAAVINTEYVPKPDGSPKDSPVGALGPAQVMPLHVGDFAPWLNRKLTLNDLKNPKTNIRFGAHYFAQALAAHGGDYDAAYRGYGPGDAAVTYNKGYSGASPFATVPNSYVATGGTSPQDQAANAQEQKAATQQLTDPWAVIGQNGKLRYVNSASPPKNAITYAGSPLPRSQFLQMWQNRLNPIFESYTGKEATAKEAAAALAKGTSDYHLQTQLANSKAFFGSPVWRADAPGYTAVWRSVYGNAKVDRELLRYAILHNVRDGFQELLRERPDYVHSNEFKQNTGALKTVYEDIYGLTDANAGNAIKQATLAGWTPDQFAQYLRHLPDYMRSNEYHQRSLTFLDSLGLITGQVSTLKSGAADGTPPSLSTADQYETYKKQHPDAFKTGAPLPNDPRVPHAGAPAPGGPTQGMVATL